MVRVLRKDRFGRVRSSKNARTAVPGALRLLRDVQGAALLEFAVALPLLMVFIVGIFDFSGAFNQKQKLEQAAQEGAIVAGAQPMSDIQSTTANPASLQLVVTSILNSLAGSGVLPNAGTSCTLPPAVTAPTPPGLTWSYTISGCSSGYPGDNLVIAINRGSISTSGSPYSVGTSVQVTYPYHWRFNSVIQLLLPGASYAATTQLNESATVHNQM